MKSSVSFESNDLISISNLSCNNTATKDNRSPGKKQALKESLYSSVPEDNAHSLLIMPDTYLFINVYVWLHDLSSHFYHHMHIPKQFAFKLIRNAFKSCLIGLLGVLVWISRSSLRSLSNIVVCNRRRHASSRRYSKQSIQPITPYQREYEKKLVNIRNETAARSQTPADCRLYS